MFECYHSVHMDLDELTIPEGHEIRSKTRGEATLAELPDPDDAYPTLEWEDGGLAHQHYTCSCGEDLADDARAVVNHLIDVGAYDPENDDS